MKLQTRHTALAAVLGAGLLALSFNSRAAEYSSTTRDQRMDSALQDYRNAHPNNTQPGTFARAEDSVKRGAHRAGDTVKSGASKVGHAVSNAGHKTANALRNTGDKIHEKIGN